MKKDDWKFWKHRDEFDGLLIGVIVGLAIVIPILLIEIL
jgi:hypothetical protein